MDPLTTIFETLAPSRSRNATVTRARLWFATCERAISSSSSPARKGPYADGRSVPVLLSGSAHYGTFLVTRYAGTRLNVWVMAVDHFNGARLRVRRGGSFVDAGDLAQLFAGPSEYGYDLR